MAIPGANLGTLGLLILTLAISNPASASTLDEFFKEGGKVLDGSHAYYEGLKAQYPGMSQRGLDQKYDEHMQGERAQLGRLWREHKDQLASNNAPFVGDIVIASAAFTNGGGYYAFDPAFYADAGVDVTVQYNLLDALSGLAVFDPAISSVSFSIIYPGQSTSTFLGLAAYSSAGASLGIHLNGFEPIISAAPLDSSGAPVQYFRDDGDDTGRAITFAMGVVGSDFVARVPEPASWALMLAGFGLMGASLRARARTVRG